MIPLPAGDVWRRRGWHEICTFLLLEVRDEAHHPPPPQSSHSEFVTLSARVGGEELLALTYFSDCMTTHLLPGIKILFPDEEGVKVVTNANICLQSNTGDKPWVIWLYSEGSFCLDGVQAAPEWKSSTKSIRSKWSNGLSAAKGVS